MAKRILILLLVLMTPFTQARAVLLCTMMNQAPVERCTCPDEHHPQSTERAAAHRGCCTFVMEVGTREIAAPAPHASQVTPQQQSWDEIPLIDVAPIIDAAIVAAPSAPRSAAMVQSHTPLPVYLATARLRL